MTKKERKVFSAPKQLSSKTYSIIPVKLTIIICNLSIKLAISPIESSNLI